MQSHWLIAHLSVKSLMLPGHEQNAPNSPGHFELSGGNIAVHFEQALPNPTLEVENR